ncbi:MAG: alpha/beta hydrolase [Pseudomonadota bacterium]
MIRTLLPLLALLLVGPATAQTLELDDCRISAGSGMPSMKARCGMLTRPLDPSGQVEGDIELRVAVVPALNLTPETDPVVPIAGGPGQGSVQFYTAYSSAFEPVRRNRDILLVDQRGTGDSATMDCEFDDDLVEGQYSTELTIKYTQQCLDELPHDARFFTTSVAVQDLDAVREALGYPALNLYGVSYGSRVAQHYARQYPQHTRTITIDVVVPPQKSLGPEIATESQAAVDNILGRCLDDTACSEHFPNIDQTFDDVLARLTDAPVDVVAPHPSTGRPEAFAFGQNEFAVAIRLLAYSPRSIALMPLLIHEAGEGHYVPLASQYLMTMISLTDALSLGMHNSVMCSEDVPFFDPETIDYDALAASYMGPLQLDALEAICSIWPAGPIDDGFKEPLATDLPVLLLSGDVDPITPPSWANLAMVDMDNARHLIGKDQGHGQIAVGCMPEIVADFIETADPQSLDTDCMERSFVMPFFVDFSGPAP